MIAIHVACGHLASGVLKRENYDKAIIKLKFPLHYMMQDAKYIMMFTLDFSPLIIHHAMLLVMLHTFSNFIIFTTKKLIFKDTDIPWLKVKETVNERPIIHMSDNLWMKPKKFINWGGRNLSTALHDASYC